jgi:lipoic acid synthetase
MGPNCTRGCSFCDISGGKPKPLDPEEPANVARMAAEMELSHVVVTSVDRDDLSDEGAEHFQQTVYEIKKALPEATIELLTPDFHAREELLKTILDSGPNVFNHNVETVPRLYPEVRPQADYRCSLDVLAFASRNYPEIKTKSGLMVGLGETTEELAFVFTDLAAVGVKILTIGQYLPPSRRYYPLDRYYTPEEFVSLKQTAQDRGIPIVVSGPLVRSSYRAGSLMP